MSCEQSFVESAEAVRGQIKVVNFATFNVIIDKLSFNDLFCALKTHCAIVSSS